MDLEAKVKKVGRRGQRGSGRFTCAGRRPLAASGGWGARATGPETALGLRNPETWERRRVVRARARAREGGPGHFSPSNHVQRLEVFETFLKMFQLRLCLPKRKG